MKLSYNGGLNYIILFVLWSQNIQLGVGMLFSKVALWSGSSVYCSVGKGGRNSLFNSVKGIFLLLLVFSANAFATLGVPSLVQEGDEIHVNWDVTSSCNSSNSFRIQVIQGTALIDTYYTSYTNSSYNIPGRSPGEYEIRLASKVCQSSGYFYSHRDDGDVEVFEEQENLNSSLPSPAPFAQGSHDPTVGGTGGEYSVNPDGSFSYSIPIHTPGGIAGIKPSLSLAYSSNGGDGFLGFGWTVSGMSSILRCPSNKARGDDVNPIDFSSTDRFCLDGMLLVAISGNYGGNGTEYRTESDDGTRIFSYGTSGTGPTRFEIQTMSGLTVDYGSTEESRVYQTYTNDGGDSWQVGNTVASWSHSRTEDRFGNYYYIDYEKYLGASAGSNRVTEIHYTGNSNGGVYPSQKVQFHYKTGYSKSGYLGGARSMKNWYIDRISVHTPDVEQRSYEFKYNIDIKDLRRGLYSIQECVGDICKNPTQFRWFDKPTYYAERSGDWTGVGYTSVSWKSSGGAYEHYFDIDGDGDADRFWWPSNRSDGYYLSYNDGTYFRPPQKVLNANVTIDGTSVPVQPGTSGTSIETYFDMDGDGDIDRIWERRNYNTNKYSIYWAENTGQGFTDFHFAGEWAQFVNVTARYATFIDMNGDGLVDYVYKDNYVSGRIFVALNNGSGEFTNPQIWIDREVASSDGEIIGAAGEKEFYVDMNGDGYPDKVWTPVIKDTSRNVWSFSKDIYVSLNNNGEGFSAPSKWLDSSKSQVPIFSFERNIEQYVDLNGDGLPDRIWLPNCQGGDCDDYFAAINTGSGFLQPTKWLDTRYDEYAESAYGRKEIYRDITGDGLPERLWVPKNKTFWYVAFNTGKEFKNGRPYIQSDSISVSSENGAYEAHVDLNKDGILDYVWNPQGLGDEYHVALTQPAYKKVVEVEIGNVGSGDGHITKVVYSSHAKGVNAGVTAEFPYYIDRSPELLVGSISTSNGLGGWFSSTYQYSNKRVHLSRYGNLGFGSMSVKNNQTNRTTYTYFNQDPDARTVGAISKIVKPDSRVYNKWETVKYGSGERAYFQFQLESTLVSYGNSMGDEYSEYEYNDWGLTTTSRTRLYDAKGSYDESTGYYSNSSSLAREKIVVNTYDFVLGSSNAPLATRTDTTVSTPKNGSIVKTATEWDHDPSNGNTLRSRVMIPDGGNSYIKQTEFSNFDVFGNHKQEHLSGPDFPSRYAYSVYDSKGRLVESTNTKGDKVYSTFYPDNHVNAGLVDVVTDINGIKTKNIYDVFGRLIEKVNYFETSKPISEYMSMQWCSDIAYSDAARCVSTENRKPSYRISLSVSGGSGSHSILDVLGREIKQAKQSLDGRYVYVENFYNSVGRNYKVTAPYFDGEPIRETLTEFDTKGRPTRLEAPNGVINIIEYKGLVEVSRNDILGKNQSKTVISDVMGNTIEVRDSLNNATQFKYDAVGNLTSMVDESGNETEIEYDSLGRKTRMDDPNKGEWKYTYDGLGQLITQTNAKNTTTCNRYDVLGRLVRRYETYSGSTSYGQTVGATSNATNSCANAGSAPYSYWIYDNAPGKGKGKLQETGLSTGEHKKTVYYDATYGLTTRVVERIDGIDYVTDSTYDNLHRPHIVTYPGRYYRVKTISEYNNLGFLKHIKNGNNNYWSEVLYAPLEMDANGQIIEETMGNGIRTFKRYDLVTNYIRSIDTYAPGDGSILPPSIQELEFEFDVLGNLTSREDLIQGVSETFDYDDLNRLKTADTDFGFGVQRVSATYDEMGNIKSKTGVGSYDYGKAFFRSCASVSQDLPHAVTQIVKSGVTKNYCYDANGNMTSGDGRHISYSAFDKPTNILRNGNQTRLYYGSDRARFKRIDTKAGANTTYRYVGGLYEAVSHPNGDVEERSFIGGFGVYTHTRKASGSTSEDMRYMHKDHLGSVVAITDKNGTFATDASGNEQLFSFDAWGKRRAPNLERLTHELGTWSSMTADERRNITIQAMELASPITNRGFTGHEQMDGVGLIHMNGRVYDADIGRFLSADPHIQSPTNSQSLNRYSYVLNNPLSFTDPTGYFFKALGNAFAKLVEEGKRFVDVRQKLKEIGTFLADYPAASTVVGVVLTAACGPCSAVYWKSLPYLYAAIAKANGASTGEALTDLAVGMVAGAVGGFVGAGAGKLLGGTHVANFVGSAMVSGAAAKAQGGKFIHGVMSAAGSAASQAMLRNMSYAGDALGGGDETAGGESAEGSGGLACPPGAACYSKGANQRMAEHGEAFISSLSGEQKALWEGYSSNFKDGNLKDALIVYGRLSGSLSADQAYNLAGMLGHTNLASPSLGLRISKAVNMPLADSHLATPLASALRDKIGSSYIPFAGSLTLARIPASPLGVAGSLAGATRFQHLENFIDLVDYSLQGKDIYDLYSN